MNKGVNDSAGDLMPGNRCKMFCYQGKMLDLRRERIPIYLAHYGLMFHLTRQLRTIGLILQDRPESVAIFRVQEVFVLAFRAVLMFKTGEHGRLVSFRGDNPIECPDRPSTTHETPLYNHVAQVFPYGSDSARTSFESESIWHRRVIQNLADC